MSPRSRRADRWLWSDDELDRAASYLRRLCNGDPIHMREIQLASSYVTGTRRHASALRSALLDSGRIQIRTPLGRTADYLLVDRSTDPSTGGPSTASA
jgi:hypothetical protein